MAGFLKYVRPMVFQVIGTMTQQISFLEEATGHMRGAVQGIEAAWLGEDSEAFAREVSERFLPAAAAVIPALAAMAAAFSRAAAVIEQADREAKEMAEGLQQELARVF